MRQRSYQKWMVVLCWLAGSISCNSQAETHGLILTIGEYANPSASLISPSNFDAQLAREMFQRMGVPDTNIVQLKDQALTYAGLHSAFKQIVRSTNLGDDVFIFYSGHGYRSLNSQGACETGLVPHDNHNRQWFSSEEFKFYEEQLISKGVRNLRVFMDSCHSGGVINQPAGMKSLSAYNKPKAKAYQRDVNELAAMLGISPEQTVLRQEKCVKPVNAQAISKGGIIARSQNTNTTVRLSASRENEISFDTNRNGSFATLAWRDCLVTDASDTNISGSIDAEELNQCATQRAQAALAKHMLRQTPVRTGDSPSLAKTGVRPPSVATQIEEIKRNSNANWKVKLTASTKKAPGIEKRAFVGPEKSPDNACEVNFPGQDKILIETTSDRDGYLYLFDVDAQQRVTLLFPNTCQSENRIKKNKPLTLGNHPDWCLPVSSPYGKGQFLAIVYDNPSLLETLVPKLCEVNASVMPESKGISPEVYAASVTGCLEGRCAGFGVGDFEYELYK